MAEYYANILFIVIELSKAKPDKNNLFRIDPKVLYPKNITVFAIGFIIFMFQCCI